MERDPLRDIARGITLLEMEVTNHVSSLVHAPPSANTLTYADTVFPTFSFISGMSRPSWQTGLKSVGLGLAYNLLIAKQDQPKGTVRLFGVLQRHGLAALLLCLAPPTSSTCSIVFPIVCSSLWMLLSIGLAEKTGAPFRDPAASAETKLTGKLCSFIPWARTRTPSFEPEGLLGTLMTAVSMWWGNFCLTNSLSPDEAFITSVSLMSFGYMFSYAFPRTCPLSKSYWTPSYTLFTSGLSLLKYTAIKTMLPHLPVEVRFPLKCLGVYSLYMTFLSVGLDRLGVFDWIRRQAARAVPTGVAEYFASGTKCLMLAVVASTVYIYR